MAGRHPVVERDVPRRALPRPHLDGRGALHVERQSPRLDVDREPVDRSVGRELELVTDGRAPHDGGQGVVVAQKAGRAHSVVAGQPNTLGEVRGVQVAQHGVDAGRVDAAAHDVHRARQLEERAGMPPRAVVVDGQERQPGGGETESDLEERRAVAHLAGEIHRLDAVRHTRQVDIRRRARRRRRQDTKRPVRLAGEHEPGVGDVPARPVAIGGARPHLRQQRRRRHAPKVDRFARGPTDAVPAVGGGRMDDDVARPVTLLAARALVVAAPVDDREVVESGGMIDEHAPRMDQAPARSIGLVRVGRRPERSRGDARRSRLLMLPGRRGQWVIEEVHGPPSALRDPGAARLSPPAASTSSVSSQVTHMNCCSRC